MSVKTYEPKDLVTVAKRLNNNKRPYLYVNPLQGKHIPVAPKDSMKVYQTMGRLLSEKYPNEHILTIGFAETATAIGLAVSMYASNVLFCMHTTRESYEDAEYLFFTESHSHATDQKLIINNLSDVLKDITKIIFVEDEVTTGNTILKLIHLMKNSFSDYSGTYGILSIINSMDGDRLYELEGQGISCDYICKIPYEYNIKLIEKFSYCQQEKVIASHESFSGKNQFDIKINSRYIINKEEYFSACKDLWKRIENMFGKSFLGKKILVLGTEEFMFPAMFIAYMIEKSCPNVIVKNHATTRSPIMVSKDDGYPLFCRFELPSMYDEQRNTYIYNLVEYDFALVVTDAMNITEKSYSTMDDALFNAGIKRVEYVMWN